MSNGTRRGRERSLPLFFVYKELLGEYIGWGSKYSFIYREKSGAACSHFAKWGRMRFCCLCGGKELFFAGISFEKTRMSVLCKNAGMERSLDNDTGWGGEVALVLVRVFLQVQAGGLFGGSGFFGNFASGGAGCLILSFCGFCIYGLPRNPVNMIGTRKYRWVRG